MVKIIKNGRVIDPESRFDGKADLWIENGKIQKIVKKDTKAESDAASDAPSIPADAEVLDAEGLIVAPGLVDVHVHFRDPGLTYKEDKPGVVRELTKLHADGVYPPTLWNN